MKLKNINGTSDNSCKCASWLAHWKKYSPLTPVYCPVEGCWGVVEVGAHVQKHEGNDSAWYIVPLCKTHNAEKGKSITVSDSIKLVSANVSQTCGKK